jgi:putative pyruvate formate lyase activating enzyme
MNQFTPNYINLQSSGELQKKVADAYTHLAVCDVCALNCPMNRLLGKLGACQTGERARISSYGLHHGEEKPISGWRGSGTIFFSRCNLHCQYCQNYDISQVEKGIEVEPDELAEIMLQLQVNGCHNINFVSPSHVVPQILAALSIAVEKGLNIPLVYNSGGYDSQLMLNLLGGVIDIYMPDMKYSDSVLAKKYSKIPHYAEVNRQAIKEMHRQVGDLRISDDGLAIRGLLVRHLVLPNSIAGTDKVAKFLSDEISKNTYINIMDQYHPCYQAYQYPELQRRITQEEYQDAFQLAINAGLYRFATYDK